MNRSDPAVRAVMIKQRLLFREMRKEGKTLCRGFAYQPAANTDVSKLWERYDYVAPSKLKEMA